MASDVSLVEGKFKWICYSSVGEHKLWSYYTIYEAQLSFEDVM